MGNRFDGYVTVLAPGVQQATGASSSGAISIPVCLSGELPRYIRVAATAAACIRLGVAGVAATGGDMQIQPGDSQLMEVPLGVTKFAVIQVSTGGQVQVSPLENM